MKRSSRDFPGFTTGAITGTKQFVSRVYQGFNLKGQIESGVLYFVAPGKTCGKELVIEMGVSQQVNHVLDIPRGF